jgi:prepilin-type N-terminal cleavage/methylation domain-containing protein
MKRRRGFTLIELLVVIAIISLLLTMLLPSIGGVRELGRQAACLSNMRNLGQALVQYAGNAANRGVFPNLDSTFSSPNDDPTDNTWTDDPNIGGTTGLALSLKQCSMQNMWLLVTTGVAQDAIFFCPSDSERKPRPNASGETRPRKYGWTSLDQFSYGIQWPYDPNATEAQRNYATPLRGDKLDPGVVIAADKNPGGAVSTSGSDIRTPSNHPTGGEAFLTKNNDAKFWNYYTDSRCGKDNDDIYVNNNNEVGGKPCGTGSDASLRYTDTSITPAKRR